MELFLSGLALGLVLGMALVGLYVILLFAFKDRRITRTLLSGFWQLTLRPWFDLIAHVAGVSGKQHGVSRDVAMRGRVLADSPAERDI